MTEPKIYTDYHAWAQALRDVRARLGISREEAASRVGVSTRTWISWESRQYLPNKFTQIAVRKAFPDLA